MSQVGQPLSNSWSTSSQPDFVRVFGKRKTVQNRQGKILYAELLKNWPTLGQLIANSPPHGKLQGSSLQSLKTLTSLNKAVRSFFLGDNSIWKFFPLFLPLAITAFGGLEGYFSLAITAFGAFEYIVPKYYCRLGKGEMKESRLLNKDLFKEVTVFKA